MERFSAMYALNDTLIFKVLRRIVSMTFFILGNMWISCQGANMGTEAFALMTCIWGTEIWFVFHSNFSLFQHSTGLAKHVSAWDRVLPPVCIPASNNAESPHIQSKECVVTKMLCNYSHELWIIFFFEMRGVKKMRWIGVVGSSKWRPLGREGSGNASSFLNTMQLKVKDLRL